MLAGLLAARRLTPARRIVVFVSLLSVVVTILQLVIAQSRRSNLWLSYITLPLEVALVVWALAYWQPTRALRRRFYWGIAAVFAAQVLLLPLEDLTGFSKFSGPVLGLMGLGASLFTLVPNAIDETEALWRQDWFWVTAGFALYFGSLATIMPLANLLVGDRSDLVLRAWQLFTVAGITANTMVAIGMVCPARAGAPAPVPGLAPG